MQINSSANSSQIALPKVNKLTDRVFNKLDPSNTGSFNKASFEKMITQGSGGNSASKWRSSTPFQWGCCKCPSVANGLKIFIFR